MTEAKPIRVLIVDDHPVVRRGISFSLMAVDDIVVVAEAESGQAAIALCQTVQPDLVLMDIFMPGMDGVATTREIRKRFPKIQVLVLTSFPEPKLVRNALRAGAIGYLLKDVPVEGLAQAIRNANAGQSTLHRAATEALMQAPPAKPAITEELTDRQREVLALVAEGYNNQQIANQLFVTVPTVRFHLSGIMAKLGATNRAKAAAMAIKYDLLD